MGISTRQASCDEKEKGKRRNTTDNENNFSHTTQQDLYNRHLCPIFLLPLHHIKDSLLSGCLHPHKTQEKNRRKKVEISPEAEKKQKNAVQNAVFS